MLIQKEGNSIAAIVESIYPSILENLWDPKYFQERAILAPTHEVGNVVNDYILSLIPGEEKTYLSSDNICKADAGFENQVELYSTDFLNSIKCSGIPNHKMFL